ncbi:MAG: AMP-binding protein [Proteobacteria bacterium]|nr:AMP-binding protein [Pseudomonadota bacterium]
MNKKNLSQLPALLVGLSDKTPLRKNFLISKNNITYGQIREQVAKTRSLFRRFELKVADRLIVASSDKITVVAIYTACIMEGMTAVILDPNASTSEITVLLNRVSPKVAFFDQIIIESANMIRRQDTPIKIIPIAKTLPKRTVFSLMIRNKTKNSSKISYPELLNDEHLITGCLEIPQSTPALILFTSGTTSQPKGVVLTHLNLESQLQTLISQFDLNKESKLVNHLPLHHSDGLNQGPILTLATGATWIAPPAANMNNVAKMLDTIYRERATHFITIPAVLAMMRRLPATYDDSFSSSEFCFIESTASLLEENLWREIEQRFKVKIVNCYGLTETVCEATYCGPDNNTRKVGTIGKPIGCEARIVNESGESVKNGGAGELLLRGNNIMKNYFDDDDTTKNVYYDGWFKTGDLAVCDIDGFYKIVGRINNLIIRGGVNIQPEDVSSVLLKYPHVNAAVTIGIKDEFLGEKVISCITLSVADTETSIDDIFVHCRSCLAKEKIPNDIILFDELPCGPSGKVNLMALQELVAQKDRHANLATSLSALSLQEKVISVATTVFHTSANILNLESNQENTDGWNSLAFLEFIMLIEKTFDFKIEPKDIMNINALGDMVAIVKQKNTLLKVELE